MQIFSRTDGSLVDEDVDVVEDNFHVFWVSNEVRGEVSGMELYAVDLGAVAGAAWGNGVVADSTGIVFHISQNALIYRGKLSSHTWNLRRSSFARGRNDSRVRFQARPVEKTLESGRARTTPVNLSLRFAQSNRKYCAEGTTSKIAWGRPS